MARSLKPTAAASEAGRALNAARQRKLSPGQRAELSRQAALTRWRRYREAKAEAESAVA